MLVSLPSCRDPLYTRKLQGESLPWPLSAQVEPVKSASFRYGLLYLSRCHFDDVLPDIWFGKLCQLQPKGNESPPRLQRLTTPSSRPSGTLATPTYASTPGFKRYSILGSHMAPLSTT